VFHTTISRFLVALFIFAFGPASVAQAMSTALSQDEIGSLRQAAVAIIGPYRETAELGPTFQTDESIGFGAAIAAWKNDDGDVRAVVGAPFMYSQRGAVYVFTRMHGTMFWHQQLIATGEASLDQFGAAVAIDGDTLAVGAPNHDNAGPKGAAYVYVYDSSSNKWTQQGFTFSGANAYGSSVALSGDMLAISAPGFGSGSVAVYSRSAGAWMFNASATPPDSPPGAQFGGSVALDGQHLLVGAPQDSSIAHQNLRGSAYVFELDTSDGHYKFQQKLIAGLDGAAGDTFGTSVSLNGNIAVIGVPGRSNSRGAVNSFRFDGSTWILQPTLSASGGSANDEFGSSVAAGVGTLAVGARFVNTSAGNLYTYNGGPCSGSSPCPWTPTSTPTLGNETGDRLGTATALAGDTLFVGAPQYDLPAPGYVQSLSFDGRQWGSEQRIEPFSEDRDGFGGAIAISGNRAIVAMDTQATLYERRADGSWLSQAAFEQNGCYAVAINGDTVVIGLSATKVGSNSFQGIASVYVKDGSGWSKQQDLSDPLGKPNDRFGCSVGISGNTIAIGALGVNSYRGSGYIFARTGSSWTMQARLSASDASAYDKFGYSVSIDGNAVVIGAPYHSANAGAAYLFTRSGSTWSQRKELNGEAAADYFGSALALSGNTMVIGAPYHDGNKGRSYIYTGSGSSWALQKALDAPTPIAGGYFGSAIGLSGDRIVVGESGNAAAHVFTRSGSTWPLRASLGSGSFSLFGFSVGLSGTSVLVGAPYDQISGRAYFFDESDLIFANGFN
jgi:FG-GAP repeat